jgi:hypothetical protein
MFVDQERANFLLHTTKSLKKIPLTGTRKNRAIIEHLKNRLYPKYIISDMTVFPSVANKLGNLQ